ncbi:MAG: formimidoylglutamate deiminase [Bifidobacterium aquikefiri]|uniref:N-formimino-L-glutamate deiminase n=2 Tax=Bifidobacterium aquikefiri TaxID=1653207 RepID=A0A261G2U4_9BIFI|nr:formimidoylglutamate deiminase [Bifidobacterium aquikefiri]OZG65739.1 N-formimino-L-glutamate deiminase [Bifidobacterium aquikefiri]
MTENNEIFVSQRFPFNRHVPMQPSQLAYWAPCVWKDNKVRSSTRIIVQEGVIAKIECNVPKRAEDIALHGMVIPGAANCHAHTFHRALRGLGKEGGTFWKWRETMYHVAHGLTPELYYCFARAVYTEMVMHGYTTVAEFHYIHHHSDGSPYEDPNIFGKALIQAALDSGIRLTLLDACYLHADVEGSSLGRYQKRFGDGSVAQWQERAEALDDEIVSRDYPTIQIGAAVHSVRACTLEEIAAVTAWAQSGKGHPLHVHLSEQIAENESCRKYTGMTPTQLLNQAGFWGPESVAVHATHMEHNDISILEASGSSVAMCPTTEADLADGIGPARMFQEHGIPLCVGSDECVCIDPFEEIRLLDAHERLASGNRDAFSPEELLNNLTAVGQAACGWKRSGLLREGYNADFIAIDMESLRTAGSSPESVPITAVGEDVSDVVINGRQIVQNKRHSSGISAARDIANISEIIRN